MPVFGNLDAIHRNHLIIIVLLLLFCPWHAVTLAYVILLAYLVNEGEEEKVGETVEDHMDMYLELFGYNSKQVSEILAEQDKFLRIDLQGCLTDYEVKHGKRIVKDILQELKQEMPRTAFYEWGNDGFQGVEKERYDVLMQAMEFAQLDWETLVPIRVPSNDLVIESLDFGYDYLIVRHRRQFANELTSFRLCQAKVFTNFKKNLFSKWYLQAHLDQWLDALPLHRKRSSFDIIEETIIDDERRKRYPELLHKPLKKSKNGKAAKGDQGEIYKIDVFNEIE